MSDKIKRLTIVSAIFLLGLLTIAVGIILPSHLEARASNDFVVDRIPFSQVEIVSLSGRQNLRVGQDIQLGVRLNPYFAIDTVHTIRYEVVWGESLVDLQGNIVRARSLSVGGRVEIRAIVDGMVSHNLLELIVESESDSSNTFVPVTSVESIRVQNHRRVEENTVFRIDELINTTILPTNATQQHIDRVEVTQNAHLVQIVGNEVRIRDNIPSGNLRFGLRAWSFGVQSNEVVFDIYVPVRGIDFRLDNPSMTRPQSRMNSSDSVSFVARVTNASATNQDVSVFVERGAELIDDIDTNGDEIVGDAFDITKNLTHILRAGDNLSIVLRAEAGGVAKHIDNIIVEIPAETVAVRLNTRLHRGDVTNFTMLYNANGSGQAGFVSNENGIEARVEATRVVVGSDLRISVPQISIDVNAQTIQVPTHTPGHTRIDVASWIVGQEDKSIEQSFFVEGIQNASFVTSFVNRSTPSNHRGFAVVFGNDSGQVGITSDARQLHHLRNTNITVLYDGMFAGDNVRTLSAFGLMIDRVEIVNPRALTQAQVNAGLHFARINNLNRETGTFNLSIGTLATGRDSIGIRVYMRDGGDVIPLYTGASSNSNNVTERINVFVPMSGGLNASAGTTIVNRDTIFNPVAGSGWNSNSTFGIDSLRLHVEQNRGVSVVENDTVRVNNRVSGANSAWIEWRFVQEYNATSIEFFSNRISLTLRHATLDVHGGTGGTRDILLINGVNDAITAPTRADHVFRGYFTGTNGTGTHFFNPNGTRTNNNFTATTATTLHAFWVRVRNHITIHHPGHDSDLTNGNIFGSNSHYDSWTSFGMNLSHLRDIGRIEVSFNIIIDHRRIGIGFVWGNPTRNFRLHMRNNSGDGREIGRISNVTSSGGNWASTNFIVTINIASAISEFGSTPQIRLSYHSAGGTGFTRGHTDILFTTR